MKKRRFAASRSPKLGEVPMGLDAPQLDAEIQAKIGRQLGKLYDEMVNQGVPDRFRNLLERLDGPGKNNRDSQ